MARIRNIETPHSMETLVYDRTMMDWRTHKGIDIASEMGAKVFAAATGTVEKIYDDQMMGTTVILYHGGGLRSIYRNLASTPAVSAGALVDMGDVVGAVGDTAIAEAGEVTHLHFEMTERRTDRSLIYLPASKPVFSQAKISVRAEIPRETLCVSAGILFF
jgi:murein DD-endopeptidase MepM/ murein hydrolase activator NlpD